MLQILLAIHFLLTIAIIGLILLQKHDSDGALGSSGGGSASGMLFSVRGQANLLTKSTAVLMTIFLVNCLSMAKLTKKTQVKGSLIDAVAAQNTPADTKSTEIPGTTQQNVNTKSPVDNPVDNNVAEVPTNLSQDNQVVPEQTQVPTVPVETPNANN